MVIAVSYILICKPASVIIALALKKHTDSLSDSDTNKAIEHKSELENETNSTNEDSSTFDKNPQAYSQLEHGLAILSVV